jgi:hypothetical protein
MTRLYTVIGYTPLETQSQSHSGWGIFLHPLSGLRILGTLFYSIGLHNMTMKERDKSSFQGVNRLMSKRKLPPHAENICVERHVLSVNFEKKSPI